MNRRPAPSAVPARLGEDPASTDDRWDWHRRRLLVARMRILQMRDEHRLEAKALGEPAVEDSGDKASEATERDLLMSELHVEEQELAEIDAALERIRTGAFGTCERTGRPIPWERLRAVPWARYAVESPATTEPSRKPQPKRRK